MELGGHQPQPLGACKIEAGSRNAQAVLGLATQKLGCHDRGVRLLGFAELKLVSAQCLKCQDRMLVPG